MIALNLAYIGNKLYKTLDYWPRDTLNLDFLEKGLGIVYPRNFVYNFSRKIFLMLYSINWPTSLPNYLYNLIYWTVCVLQLQLIFLIQKFSYCKDKILNNLGMKRAFKVKQKAFSNFFKDFQLPQVVSDPRVRF